MSEVRLDRLLGRNVLAGNNQTVGRLEEFRAVTRGGEYEITEYVIGPAGLFERLGVAAKRLFGVRLSGYVASWDQVDISDPDHPRLTCALRALVRF